MLVYSTALSSPQPIVTPDQFQEAPEALAKLNANDWAGAERILIKLDSNWRTHEEEFAKRDKTWRGEGRESSGAPYTVRYNTPQNLAKMIERCYEEGVLPNDATLLLAFRYLLADGKLPAVPNEQRPTHNPPATPESVRKSQEAWEKQHADQRKTVQQVRQQRKEFADDLFTVLTYSGQGTAGGLRSHAATYVGRRQGLDQLKLKWANKFTGQDLIEYNEAIANAERQVERLNSSGGAVSNTGHDPRVVQDGGTITDVQVTAADEAARQEHNRHFLK